jgi:peptidyl-Lys metalloendopeptidase
MNHAPALLAGTMLLAGAVAAATSATAASSAARTNPLRVSMVAASGTSGFLGAVDVQVTNTGDRIVRVPSWQLPETFLQAKLFQVSRDGQAVAYEGPMIKRGLPSARDFVILQPGQTVRATVDLSAFYDMSRSGEYTVAFSSPLQYASLSSGHMLKTANGLPMRAQSAPLKLWVDGTDQLGARQLKAARKPSTGTTVVNGISYKSCSTTQINTLGSAITAARNYSENSKGYLNAGTTGSRYTTWFGAYTSTRYATARQNFVAIDSAMDQSGGQVTINCGCNQSYYA